MFVLSIAVCVGPDYYLGRSPWPPGSLELLCAASLIGGLFGAGRAVRPSPGSSDLPVLTSLKSTRTWGFFLCLAAVLLALLNFVFFIPHD